MYEKCFKRVIDFTLSVIALIVLSPALLILIIVGAIAMRGNPLFLQPRPGKKGKNGKEKIFKLMKFRTMSNAKDKNGNLLPDDQRLGKYASHLYGLSKIKKQIVSFGVWVIGREATLSFVFLLQKAIPSVCLQRFTKSFFPT